MAEKKLAFLLYAPSRASAKRETKQECKKQGITIAWMHTHDVTITEDEIRQIDNLVQ